MRYIIYEKGNFMQADFYTNEQFLGSLVAMSITDPNTLIQLEFVNIVSAIVKTQRGVVLRILIETCSYPTTMLISI